MSTAIMIVATDEFSSGNKVFAFVEILLRKGSLSSTPVAVHYQVFLGPLYGLKYSRDSKLHNS
jgi:hypothetical protein